MMIIMMTIMEEVPDSKNWAWLPSGNLKKEIEGFRMTAQDQSLRTNVVKVKTDKQEGNVRCRNVQRHNNTRFSFFGQRTINVWNSLPDCVDFRSLSSFTRTILLVNFNQFLKAYKFSAEQSDI